MAKYQLEVGARTVEDALSAWRGGADRVELYVSPTEGALTPSMGLVQAAVAAKKAANSNLGLFVMLRPRSGDFLYSDADFDTLLRDTENASLDSLQKRQIMDVLARAQSRKEAAEILGLSKTTLWRKCKEFGLD